MRRAWALLLLLLAPFAEAQQPGRTTAVLTSSHSLDPRGRGFVTTEEAQACSFCHISHGGDASERLWNQRLSTAGYTSYESPSMAAAPGDPSSGSSKLCLSCHDGTVAIGTNVGLGRIPVSGAMPASAITGTNLGRHHPVGIRPVDDGQVYYGLGQTPATSADPAVTLPRNIIECTTCHDPHVEDNDPRRRRFLVRSNESGALCLACHDPTRPAPSVLSNWTGSAHFSAAHTVNESYGSVRANACSSCHLPHEAPGSLPLLRAVEEATCAACHGGHGTSPSLPSVMAELNKGYAHPVTEGVGLHSPEEGGTPLEGARHAECADCHNPHAAGAWTPSVDAPAVSPPLRGVPGVDSSGRGGRAAATNEYEICFKCHGGSSGKPQGPDYAAYGYTAARQTDSFIGPFDTQVEFTSPVARHNVVQPRRLGSGDVPSLRGNMLTLGRSGGGRSLAVGTFIYCSDCHNSDQTRSAGGSGAAGVHGSNWPHILERRYDMESPPAAPGGATAGVAYQSGPGGSAALCAKCHDVDGSIVRNQSFKAHQQHVVGENTSCATCHDSHGISGGTSSNNKSLVNFDLAIVGPSSSGILRFESTGTFSGRCFLRCHGKDHNPIPYGGP